MEFNIDPKDLNLQDAAGMQLVEVIRNLADESGTTDYEDLENLPKINGVTLKGNKSSDDLHIVVDYEDLENLPKINGVTLVGNKSTEDLNLNPSDEQVAEAVDAWLDDNVTQETGYVLDDSLTLSNAAAPADKVGELKSDLSLIGFEKHVASNNKIDGSYYIGKTGDYLNNAVILFGCGMTTEDITNIAGNLYVMSKDTDDNTLQGVVFKICDSSGDAISSDWLNLGTFYPASGFSASELAGRGLLFKAYSAAANYTIASLYVTPGVSTVYPPDAYKEEATITTDKTLSLSDIPADAKAAGDAIEDANTEISSIKSAVGYKLYVTSNNKINASAYIGKSGNNLNNAVILLGCGMTVQDVINIGGYFYVMSKDTDNNTLQGVVFKICDSDGEAISEDWLNFGTFYTDITLTSSELEGRGLLFKAYAAAENYTVASMYVTAGTSVAFPPDAYQEEATTDDKYHIADLICWGDSLTAGAGGDGTNYPDVCATELNLTVKNCGVGGESANTVSARQGGNAVVIPAGAVNGSYSTLTDVFGAEIAPLVQGDGGNSGDSLFINGDKCTLTYSSSQYTIAGYTKGTTSVPLLGRFAGSDFNGDITVIFVGANGADVGSVSDVDALITIIDSMIAHLKNNKYVVFAKWVANGTEESLSSDDAKMLSHYGNKLFPMRKMLVNYGLDLLDITPTADDLADIAVGTIPTSLRDDSIHLNANGYTAVGKFLADKIKSLGYV